ncbi:MAG: hypothetical protein OEW25_09375 [Nitrospira sp.]|nr:hypothetical protein [Nitrospira sp.]
MRTRDLIARYGVWIILLMSAMLCAVAPSAAAPAPHASPARLSEVVDEQAAQLAAIDSNAGAMALFISSIGQALGLNDAAGMLGAKGLPATLAKELGVAELSQSAHELMAALAAWQLADSIHRASEETLAASIATAASSTARREWMHSNSRLPTLSDLVRLLAEQPPPDQVQSESLTKQTALLLAAHRVAFEAHQGAIAAWWSLREWKDRVRQTRGLSRLCGTWQWTIHNHQHHQEQKTVMLFPPAGHQPPNIPLPAETVILGDSIYLRWERSGHVEEDSLLFVTDGHKKDGRNDTLRIEGSFVNNTGGWGSIAAKRTADCRP